MAADNASVLFDDDNDLQSDLLVRIETRRGGRSSLSPSDRLAAVAELAGLALPIGSPRQMEAESVPEDELD